MFAVSQERIRRLARVVDFGITHELERRAIQAKLPTFVAALDREGNAPAELEYELGGHRRAWKMDNVQPLARCA